MLDRDGRIDFGIGVGWNKEEVEICGYRWEDRGARCDEFLEVMQRLWTEPVVDLRQEPESTVILSLDRTFSIRTLR